MNIIDVFKAKAELRNLRKKYPLNKKEDWENYFFSEEGMAIRKKYYDGIDGILKNKNKIVKATAGILASTLVSVGVLAGCNALIHSSQEDDTLDITSKTEQTTDRGEIDYGHTLSQEEVLTVAEKALERVEKELTSNGAGPMGEIGTPFYPEWFNREMLASLVYIESSNRATEKDGSPLLGDEVDIGDGTIQRARGMCQILPIVVEEINYWLKTTMDSDWSYTVEDCDNPEKAMELCILINVRNCKNFFDRDEEIYSDPDYNFKNNTNLQGDCVVASYHYGAGNIIDGYYDGTLKNTYLNSDWVDGKGGNYLRRFKEVYQDFDSDMQQ